MGTEQRNPYLTELENRTLYVLREVKARLRNPAILWSMGKDSTTLLNLCRKAFFGTVPFPVLHLDTSFKFPEMYQFRDHWAKQWGLNLLVVRNEEALEQGVNPASGALHCCTQLKTNALKLAVRNYGFDGLLLAIRWDEHGVRAKERFFSPRNADSNWAHGQQPTELWDRFPVAQSTASGHLRIHPMLHWREVDVWHYILQENLPANPLYFADQGKRYRSLGCQTCTVPMDSNASTVAEIVHELQTTRSAERAGRLLDKERVFIMQKLRSLGYM